MRSTTLLRSLLLAATLTAVPGPPAAAQVRDAQEWLDRCRAGEQRWGDARERVCELRELTLPASGRPLMVDALRNGAVSVQGWDRNEILVQALVSAAGHTADEARENAGAIQVRTDGDRVRAEGPAGVERNRWSVSYRVYVPRSSDLDLRAHNGGLRVENVSGRIELGTTNGGIALAAVAGDVRGRTTNGGVSVRLDGPAWQGTGLDLRTTNGGIRLQVPDGYSARLEAGTVNGRIDTEIPITVQGDIRRNLRTQLGGGGPLLRLETTNGSVRIQRS